MYSSALKSKDIHAGQKAIDLTGYTKNNLPTIISNFLSTSGIIPGLQNHFFCYGKQ